MSFTPDLTHSHSSEYSADSFSSTQSAASDDAAVCDLRSALALLRSIPGQLIETDTETDPMGELSGVYRHVGAGGTIARPTKEGPAMLFCNVKGHPNAPVVIGLLASRRRVGYLLGCDPKRLGFLLKESVAHPVPPVVIPNEKAKISGSRSSCN